MPKDESDPYPGMNEPDVYYTVVIKEDFKVSVQTRRDLPGLQFQFRGVPLPRVHVSGTLGQHLWELFAFSFVGGPSPG